MNIESFEWSFTAGEPSLDEDSDLDGVPDDLDWFPDDPEESLDTDGDGTGDNRDDDDDNDGMPDDWEINYNLNPKDPRDASGDLDDDGIPNLEEFREGTDPIGDDDDGLSFEAVLFIVIAISVIALALIIIFALAQARKMEHEKMQKSFFRESEMEE
jgi:hypothetical protein